MLEHACLALLPWTHALDGDGVRFWKRPIVDASGALLGFARRASGRAGFWFGWVARRSIEVFETEDASHLMTFSRGWGLGAVWEIHDADDLHVGTLFARTLVTSEREVAGWLEREAARQGRILDPDDQLLASYRRLSDDRIELTFADAAMRNPFLRMLLLGSVLTMDSAP